MNGINDGKLGFETFLLSLARVSKPAGARGDSPCKGRRGSRLDHRLVAARVTRQRRSAPAWPRRCLDTAVPSLGPRRPGFSGPAEATGTIGRRDSNGLRLDAGSVSRIHGAFLFGRGLLQYVDTGSRNGTFVDGVLIEPNRPVDIRDSSVITVGPFQIIVHLELRWRPGRDDDVPSLLGDARGLAERPHRRGRVPERVEAGDEIEPAVRERRCSSSPSRTSPFGTRRFAIAISAAAASRPET